MGFYSQFDYTLGFFIIRKTIYISCKILNILWSVEKKYALILNSYQILD